MGAKRAGYALLPLLLTLCSLICLLVVTLAGVTDRNLYLIRADLSKFQLNTSSIDIGKITSRHVVTDLDSIAEFPAFMTDSRKDEPPPSVPDNKKRQAKPPTQSRNITAADLALADIYDISLWGVCTTPRHGDRACSPPAFDWASTTANDTLNHYTSIITGIGIKLKVPAEITTALASFGTAIKWAEIAYVGGLITTVVSLVVGIISICTARLEGLAFIFATLAALIVCAAAAVSTVFSLIVVTLAEQKAAPYMAHISYNLTFLIFAWAAAVLALAAALFWMCACCCCRASHRTRTNGALRQTKVITADEKPMVKGSYQRLGEQEAPPHVTTHTQFAAQPMRHSRDSTGYEPYKHTDSHSHSHSHSHSRSGSVVPSAYDPYGHRHRPSDSSVEVLAYDPLATPPRHHRPHQQITQHPTERVADVVYDSPTRQAHNPSSFDATYSAYSSPNQRYSRPTVSRVLYEPVSSSVHDTTSSLPTIPAVGNHSTTSSLPSRRSPSPPSGFHSSAHIYEPGPSSPVRLTPSRVPRSDMAYEPYYRSRF